MSERFGIKDHSPQHAPAHAPQNPTNPGQYHIPSPAAPAPQYSNYAPYPASGGGFAASAPRAPQEKSVVIAVLLSMMFGPLGLLYASLRAAGIAIGGTLALSVLVLTAAGPNVLSAISDAMLSLLWLGSVVWSVPAVRRHNRAVRACGGKQ